MKNLIIVDMQNGFVNDNNRFLVDRINNYIKENKFDYVIYTKYINNEISPFVEILNYTSLMSEDEQRFVIEENPDCHKKMVFEKMGYGLTQKMIDDIKSLGIKEAELCGTDADACVMAIAYNLFDNGIKPVILRELVGSSSRNKDITQYSITIMERSFGKENVK